MSDDAFIREQIEYYRHRVPEYDETSSPVGDFLAPFGEQVEAALKAFNPTGEVLEIASGTGTWTKHLLQHSDSVTALGSAPEMHHESRRKLGGDSRVRYVEADVLTWEPDRSRETPKSFDRISNRETTLIAPEDKQVERRLGTVLLPAVFSSSDGPATEGSPPTPR